MSNFLPTMIRALNGEELERPPVWLMRQAGRYLAEYQEIKAKHSFLEMCRTPELALEVSLQPLRLFDMDAAIVFADILLPLESMGMKIDFNPGPKVERPLKTRSDIESLTLSDPSRTLHYVMKTIKELRQTLAPEKTVIGFAGAPWTMACYILEQGPFKHFHGTQVFANEDPVAIHELLKKITQCTIDYLLAQYESGADVVQLFDSWAGNLSLEDYRRFALPYTQQIFAALKKTSRPSILYVNGSSHLLPAMCESGANCLSVDWRTSLAQAQSSFGERGSIQGNFDPSHLFGSVDEVAERTAQMLNSVKSRVGYIANLGHGVLQHTPRENVKAFVDGVKRGWT